MKRSARGATGSRFSPMPQPSPPPSGRRASSTRAVESAPAPCQRLLRGAHAPSIFPAAHPHPGRISKGSSMQPDIHLNYWAILVAVAATMVLGFLWYGPILGKAWMKEMGIPADSKPDPKVMRRGLILMFIDSLLTVV